MIFLREKLWQMKEIYFLYKFIFSEKQKLFWFFNVEILKEKNNKWKKLEIQLSVPIIRWKMTILRATYVLMNFDNRFLIGFIFQKHISHSLIRGVLIQICSAGANNFTNYVFCHPQFSGVIQNIENHCAILTPVCLWRLLSK